MEFFNIGPGELILILIVALIIFGPSKLPEIGKTLGKGIREFQGAMREFTNEQTPSEDHSVQQSSERHRCPTCGAQNPRQYQYCGQCGSVLEQVAKQQEIRVCDVCGWQNESPNRYCGQCGADIQKTDGALQIAG